MTTTAAQAIADLQQDDLAAVTRMNQDAAGALQAGHAARHDLGHQAEQIAAIHDTVDRVDHDVDLAARDVRSLQSIFGACLNFFRRKPKAPPANQHLEQQQQAQHAIDQQFPQHAEQGDPTAARPSWLCCFPRKRKEVTPLQQGLDQLGQNLDGMQSDALAMNAMLKQQQGELAGTTAATKQTRLKLGRVNTDANSVMS